LLKNYLIIYKKKIKHIAQRRLSPPTLNALLKLHKEDILIIPVMKNRTAPTYRVAKFMTTLIRENIALHNLYNIHNSNQLANDITNLKIKKTQNTRHQASRHTSTVTLTSTE
jgi:hypothetical protein